MGNMRLVVARPAILSVAKLLTVALTNLPLAYAAPFALASVPMIAEEGAKTPNDPTLWIYLAIAVALVLLGGVFAGLTIALMGQDDVNLQVVHASGEGKEKKHAGKVLRLLKRGKHWVLVTLLLGNVITNETLPIVLDRSLGGGWPAVLGSTVLIVIFGEVIPQSICVRYGLPIGAWMSPLVLVLMYILAPVAWPTAKLLDYLLGEDHGTVYKKAGLKTLVGLHKTLGTSPHERLNEDEVTIISAVLDLKDKAVGSIMTPMDDVFTMSEDAVLDEKTMDVILSQGYSRIPIHEKHNEENFVGMLLVKILITYDPEDCKRVGDFALATLPETKPDASCLDIVNYFQEGKSHMVLVSDSPGEDYGALGVVTLEDVIEELIGEEIIDESDVFIDVHKAIRRMTPAQQTRLPKRQATLNKGEDKVVMTGELINDEEDHENTEEIFRNIGFTNGEQPQPQADNKAQAKAKASGELGTSPKTTFLIRRSSSLVNTPNSGGNGQHVIVRGNAPEMREHLKHLGPSNLASRPKQTRYNTVKIKQGASGGLPAAQAAAAAETGEDEAIKQAASGPTPPPEPQRSQSFAFETPAPQGGVGAGLLSSAGKDASDGVQALQAGYGTMSGPSSKDPTSPSSKDQKSKSKSTPTPDPARLAPPPRRNTTATSPGGGSSSRRPRSSHDSDGETSPHSTVGSLHSGSRSPFSSSRPRRTTGSASPDARRVARSGSITENVVTAGGVRKVILETTSSSSSVSDDGAAAADGGNVRGSAAGGVEIGRASASNVDGAANERPDEDGNSGGPSKDGSYAGGVGAGEAASASGAGKKKRRRRRKKGGAATGGGGGGGANGKDDEEAPLLEHSSN
ncbi:MAG: hypothetical protein M4579_000408 [Chaenotheca gracillima]|nr:MAG: hypothetical protein M4579_000408 [Chaenotheca gracillima]